MSEDLNEAEQKLQAANGEIYKIERMYDKKVKQLEQAHATVNSLTTKLERINIEARRTSIGKNAFSTDQEEKLADLRELVNEYKEQVGYL